MARIRMILPVPVPGLALSLFADQIPSTLRRDGTEIEFRGTRSGASLLDSPYELALADSFVLDAGVSAEADGCDVVCSFSMSDSGLSALRSRLSIPVVGAAQSAFALATQLGKRFSIVTMWEPWKVMSTDLVKRYDLSDRVASIRHIDVRPDTQELLSGKEELVFGCLEEQAKRAIEDDGADVIILGSTTMYQSHAYLAQALPVPVVNPGVAAYKTCETLLELGLTHSKRAYPSPERTVDDLFTTIQSVFPN
ncbi:aspartate/glutamate racemase family protein [Sphingobium sp. EM0848]|uniref:aspartate/glutamate racemase family protein n=1 Tax=Sphingobium sp. EM0848 TaxID=2743473 RepID=UPI00159C34F3|nr:aspartate/glutamate racemase family protein [Sphingobium sp. EM0848]